MPANTLILGAGLAGKRNKNKVFVSCYESFCCSPADFMDVMLVKAPLLALISHNFSFFIS